jgi:hypothetical protein
LIHQVVSHALNKESLIYQLIETEVVEEKPRTTRKRQRTNFFAGQTLEAAVQYAFAAFPISAVKGGAGGMEESQIRLPNTKSTLS